METFSGAGQTVFHFAEGDSLINSLLLEVEGTSGIVVSGSGTLTNLEVEEGDGVQRKVGAVEAVSITGIVLKGRVDLFGTFVRGTQLFGGRIVSATVRRAVLTGESVQPSQRATAHSSAKKRSVASRKSSPSSSDSIAPASVPSKPSAPKSTTSSKSPSAASGWEAAFQAAEQAEQAEAEQKSESKAKPRRHSRPQERDLSALKPKAKLKRAPRKSAPEDDHMPQAGEWVEHRQFGLCLVRAVDGDGGLTITPEGGRTKRIKLTVLRAEAPRVEGKRVIYPLVKR